MLSIDFTFLIIAIYMPWNGFSLLLFISILSALNAGWSDWSGSTTVRVFNYTGDKACGSQSIDVTAGNSQLTFTKTGTPATYSVDPSQISFFQFYVRWGAVYDVPASGDGSLHLEVRLTDANDQNVADLPAVRTSIDEVSTWALRSNPETEWARVRIPISVCFKCTCVWLSLSCRSLLGHWNFRIIQNNAELFHPSFLLLSINQKRTHCFFLSLFRNSA